MSARGIALSLLLGLSLRANTLEEAYAAQRERRYEEAIRAFKIAIEVEPRRANIRKDLAYTLLKIGENEEARDQFQQAARIDPSDYGSQLEYAFLCYETKRQAEARRTFDLIRQKAQSPIRETAAQAYENIDQPLRDGIARWKNAVQLTPDNFSAHEELARLAEQRDDLALAAEHYQQAVRLRPDRSALLLDLGRVLTARGEPDRAAEVLAKAALTPEPRTAELARELAPIPIVPDPAPAAAVAVAPTASAKEMGLKSLSKSYLTDALDFLQRAAAEDPDDGEVQLKLGEVYNLLGQDELAVQWFGKARRSANPTISRQANRAWRNLNAQTRRVLTTGWMLPMYSSRWQSTFIYGQVKTEFRFKKLPIRPYLSARVMADLGVSRTDETVTPIGSAGPLQLSEQSVIAAAGVSASLGHGIWGWFEGGQAIRYSPVVSTSEPNTGRFSPDYRGGVFTTRGWGAHLTSEEGGFFSELDLDGVYVSRYDNDMLFVAQNRLGYTTAPLRAAAGLQVQALLHTNLNADLNRQYWANFLEAGPGVRLRWKWMPPSLFLGAQYIYGGYTVMEGNPRPARYRDMRVGLWYAITR